MKNVAEELCIKAIESFYKNDKTDFTGALDENVVFYGPTNGRKIDGRDDVVKYFTEGGRKLKLSMGGITARSIQLKTDAFIVSVNYDLFAYYPDGKMLRFKQHTLVALYRRKNEHGELKWRCPLISISNVSPRGTDSNREIDSIRPYDADLIGSLLRNRASVKKIMFCGDGNSNYYIPEDSIKYVEGGKSVQCYIHTDSETVTVNHLMKDVMQRLPDYYYRCHSSYIVNLRRVKYVGGYKIHLDTGDEIPIPAKKYSAVKADIANWMAQGKI